jgi:hypothetical protein
MIGQTCATPKARDRKAVAGQGLSIEIRYTSRFASKDRIAMEAEQLNQIASSIESLRTRTADLRRYL